MQAVALRVTGDKAVFYKVRIIGTQDTLLDETGTHYYYHSFIQGRVDFICGNAKSLFKVSKYGDEIHPITKKINRVI